MKETLTVLISSVLAVLVMMTTSSSFPLVYAQDPVTQLFGPGHSNIGGKGSSSADHNTLHGIILKEKRLVKSAEATLHGNAGTASQIDEEIDNVGVPLLKSIASSLIWH